MVEYKSTETRLNKSAEEVFDYLIQPANYEPLMPSSVRSFSHTDESATLDIQGLGEVVLAITDSQKPSHISMKPQNKLPFEFDIQWQINALDENSCSATAVINAKLNFMMRMMADKILQGFLDTQVHKLQEIINDD